MQTFSPEPIHWILMALLVLGFISTKIWFWIFAARLLVATLFLCALAAFFAMLASIIHFNIIGAIVFSLTTLLCLRFAIALAGFAFELAKIANR